MNKTPFAFILALSALFAGCEKNPVDRLLNPTVSNTAGAWSGTWVIYDDEIKTGGDVMLFTTTDGQVIDFNWRESPKSGSKCIKYSWDGRDVTAYENNQPEHDYVGFSLIAADSYGQYNTVTRDLTSGGYTKVSFWVRGSLNASVYLRLETNNADYRTPSGNNAWLSNASDRKVTGDWQYYEFSLSGSLAAVRDFVRIILRYDEDGNPETPNTATGNGGVVYLDDITLSR